MRYSGGPCSATRRLKSLSERPNVAAPAHPARLKRSAGGAQAWRPLLASASPCQVIPPPGRPCGRPLADEPQNRAARRGLTQRLALGNYPKTLGPGSQRSKTSAILGPETPNVPLQTCFRIVSWSIVTARASVGFIPATLYQGAWIPLNVRLSFPRHVPLMGVLRRDDAGPGSVRPAMFAWRGRFAPRLWPPGRRNTIPRALRVQR